jgi:hypothetical protein
MTTQAGVDRKIFGRYASSYQPEGRIKELAKHLENLDTLTALVLAGRLNQLLGSYAIDGLTKLIASANLTKGEAQ